LEGLLRALKHEFTEAMMLFHVTHKHDHHSCIAHDAAGKRKLAKALNGAESAGVTLHGVYTDAPGHAIYFIIETDRTENLVKFFKPIIDMGETDIRPVLDPTAVLKILNDEG
jgi:hypothetical protein